MLHAYILNINLFDTANKLQEMGAILEQTELVTLQQFDVKDKSGFIHPIYKSLKFHEIFDELYHYTYNRQSLTERGIVLLIRRNHVDEVILVDGGNEIRLSMTRDQCQSMIKVFMVGNMKQIAHFKSKKLVYKYKSLGLQYKLWTLTGMKPYLQVTYQDEESLIEGLAKLAIPVNKAVLNESLLYLLTLYNKHLPFSIIPYLI